MFIMCVTITAAFLKKEQRTDRESLNVIKAKPMEAHGHLATVTTVSRDRPGEACAWSSS